MLSLIFSKRFKAILHMGLRAKNKRRKSWKKEKYRSKYGEGKRCLWPHYISFHPTENLNLGRATTISGEHWGEIWRQESSVCHHCGDKINVLIFQSTGAPASNGSSRCVALSSLCEDYVSRLILTPQEMKTLRKTAQEGRKFLGIMRADDIGSQILQWGKSRLGVAF